MSVRTIDELKATKSDLLPFGTNFAASTIVVVLPEPGTARTTALPVPFCTKLKTVFWY